MSRSYVLVSGDFRKTGGMDRANHALASFLAGRGEDVHVVAFHVDEDLLAAKGLTWHRVRKPMNSYSIGLPILDRRGRELASRLSPSGARVVVNGGNCRWGDVNWVHHLNVIDTPKPARGLLRRIKAGIDHRRFVSRERQALGKARLLVTTCERNRADLLERFHLDPDRIKVAYYGTDPQAFRPASLGERQETRRALGWADDRPVALFVGGLGDRRKGFDTLYAAWSILCEEPSWRADLVVVGDGAERPEWQARAEADGLADRVRFLGFRADVPAIIRAADAHVLPSRYEGYSLATHEALCCGLPAYITDTAGIAERYPASLREMLIPDPNDVPGLVDRLKRWPDFAKRGAPALIAFSESLRLETWDAMAERFANFVEQI